MAGAVYVRPQGDSIREIDTTCDHLGREGNDMNCTACGGALEDGFIPDMGHAAVWLAVWVGGQPKTGKTLWERFRTGGQGLAVDDIQAKAIEAKRCTSCGHLELFANHPPTEGTHFSAK